jgi:hypothetical protein
MKNLVGGGQLSGFHMNTSKYTTTISFHLAVYNHHFSLFDDIVFETTSFNNVHLRRPVSKSPTHGSSKQEGERVVVPLPLRIAVGEFIFSKHLHKIS